MTNFAFYDSSIYSDYTEAELSGAIYRCPSDIDIIDYVSGTGDVIELLETAQRCLGYNVETLVFGTVEDGVFRDLKKRNKEEK